MRNSLNVDGKCNTLCATLTAVDAQLSIAIGATPVVNQRQHHLFDIPARNGCCPGTRPGTPVGTGKTTLRNIQATERATHSIPLHHNRLNARANTEHGRRRTPALALDDGHRLCLVLYFSYVVPSPLSTMTTNRSATANIVLHNQGPLETSGRGRGRLSPRAEQQHPSPSSMWSPTATNVRPPTAGNSALTTVDTTDRHIANG